MKMKNLSNVFGGKAFGVKVPGVNAPLRFKDLEKGDKSLKFKNLNKKDIIKLPKGGFEKIAWQRVGKQKKLNLFGDRDKDKLFNVFDCAPYNRKKQALYHKMIGTPVGKLETYKVEEPAPEADISYDYNFPFQDIEVYKAGRKPNIEVVEEEPMKKEGPSFIDKVGWFTKKAVQVGGKVKSGVKNTLTDVGIVKTPEERIEAQKTKLEKAKLQQEVELAKIKAGESVAKYRGQLAPKQGVVRQTLGAVQGGIGAAGRTFSYGSFAAAPLGVSHKVKNLTGVGGGGGRGVYEILGFGKRVEQPSFGATPIQPTGQTAYGPQITPGEEMIVKGVRYIRLLNGKWQNTKTGVEVRYPRGVYEKKTRVIYQPSYSTPTQYPQQYPGV